MPFVKSVVDSLEMLGYQSWAHRIVGSAGCLRVNSKKDLSGFEPCTIYHVYSIIFKHIAWVERVLERMPPQTHIIP